MRLVNPSIREQDQSVMCRTQFFYFQPLSQHYEIEKKVLNVYTYINQNNVLYDKDALYSFKKQKP